jgi:protease-4
LWSTPPATFWEKNMVLQRSISIFAVAGLMLAANSPSLRADEPLAASVAHIRLTGTLDEAPLPADALFGAKENFKSKLDRIKKAKNDKAIQALYLEVDGIGVGWGKLDELRAAIADFRKAGKKAFAYIETGSSKDYLVAIACDRICVPEAGWLMLVGIRGEVTFYKDLLDYIGVRADMLQMGAYKGAAEPFTRSRMSKEYRERMESVLKDYYQESIINAIAKARSAKDLTPEKVKDLIDEGPYTARRALAAGLVDDVAYPSDFKKSFKGFLKADTVKIVKNYGQAKNQELDFSNPFALARLLMGASSKPRKSTKDKIAVIYAVGAITTGKSSMSLFGAETVGSTTLVEAIRTAEQDKTVKAIVLRVDSPGGSALASDLIWKELSRSKKPVIASMSDVAASGGYYISMAANKIFAEPGTLTGSIGVVGGKIVLGGLEKKVGLNTEVIAFGANSGILSTTTPFSPSEKKAMRAMMVDVYDQFLAKAILGRAKAGKKFTRDEIVQYAEGRIWTGRQAKKIGLVDELGTLSDAIVAAKTMAKMPKDSDPELWILPKGRSFLDTLMEGGLFGTQLSKMSLLKNVPQLAGHLAAVEGLLQLRGEPVWLIMPHRLVIK